MKIALLKIVAIQISLPNPGDKGGSAKGGSYDIVALYSTQVKVYPDVEYYTLIIEAWPRRQRWNLGGRGGGGGGGAEEARQGSTRPPADGGIWREDGKGGDQN